MDRSKWRIVTFAHVAPTREQARKDVEFGLENFTRYFTEVATFPIIPAGDRRIRAITLSVRDWPASARRTIASAISSGCGRARTADFGAVLLLAHNWADWDGDAAQL